MNIKELKGTKGGGMFWTAVSHNLSSLFSGSVFAHNQEPTADILLCPEILDSVFDKFEPICWSGRHISMLSLNILTV